MNSGIRRQYYSFILRPTYPSFGLFHISFFLPASIMKIPSPFLLVLSAITVAAPINLAMALGHANIEEDMVSHICFSIEDSFQIIVFLIFQRLVARGDTRGHLGKLPIERFLENDEHPGTPSSGIISPWSSVPASVPSSYQGSSHASMNEFLPESESWDGDHNSISEGGIPFWNFHLNEELNEEPPPVPHPSVGSVPSNNHRSPFRGHESYQSAAFTDRSNERPSIQSSREEDHRRSRRAKNHELSPGYGSSQSSSSSRPAQGLPVDFSRFNFEVDQSRFAYNSDSSGHSPPSEEGSPRRTSKRS